MQVNIDICTVSVFFNSSTSYVETSFLELAYLKPVIFRGSDSLG